MTSGAGNPFEHLPSVGKFLDSAAGKELCREFGSGAVKLEARTYIAELRAQLAAAGEMPLPGPDEFSKELHGRLLRFCTPLGRQAINATGIILHTGLGRAPLAQSALEAIRLDGYSIVQVDIDSGKRSQRDEKIERMLQELTGCEAATVVNNNAAATMIALSWMTTRGGPEAKEVIISRGQLIEIGGSFRMPDVMAQSGAVLREVGTTNRTHLKDYERAINQCTAGVVHVHPSNYRIAGFSGTPELPKLAEICRKHGLPLIADLGSGALVPLTEYGLHDVCTVGEAIKAGSTLVCFSGDKLICGPQAGILVGTKAAIGAIRNNPYHRMFRVDKLTLAALEATLLEYVNGRHRETIPLYQLLGRTLEELQGQAEQCIAAIGALAGATVEVIEERSFTGGGALPQESVPTKAVRILPANPRRLPAIAERMRKSLPAVFCRVNDDALLLDMRTVFPREIEQLAELLKPILVEELR